MEESDNIICLLCSSAIYYLDGKERFFNHLKNQHDAFQNHNLIMAINFLEKETLAGIEKQFEDWYDIALKADLGDYVGLKAEVNETEIEENVKDAIDADVKFPELDNESIIIKYLCDLCDKEFTSEDCLNKHACAGPKNNAAVAKRKIINSHRYKTKRIKENNHEVEKFIPPEMIKNQLVTHTTTSNSERNLIAKSKLNNIEQVKAVESIQDEKQPQSIYPVDSTQDTKETEKFICNHCNKQYMTENHLKKHSCAAILKNKIQGNIHSRNSEVRNFTASDKFKGSGVLYGKTFPCAMCKKEFTAVFYLGKHIVNYDHGRRKTLEAPDNTRIMHYLDKVGIGELTEEEEEELKKTYPVPSN